MLTILELKLEIKAGPRRQSGGRQRLDEEAGQEQGAEGGSEPPGSPQLLGGGSAAEPTREILITR